MECAEFIKIQFHIQFDMALHLIFLKFLPFADISDPNLAEREIFFLPVQK